MKPIELLMAVLLAGAPAAFAQNRAADHADHHPEPAASAATASMADGEVRKVDKEGGKLTLRHGPIPNLDMPAMTMVFRVAEPAMLDNLKVGDKLRFSAERVAGAITVTHIEKSR